MPDIHAALPEYHPQTIIRDLGDGLAFRLADALTGVAVFGGTGSGKTSGPSKFLAYGYLAAGFGGLVLCAKKEEKFQWIEWAAATRRTDDLIIINPDGDFRFNFLDAEAQRPGSGGFVINIVGLLVEIGGAISGSDGKSSGDHQFWKDATHTLNTNAVSLPLLAKYPVNLPMLRDVVSSAPTSVEQANDPNWQKSSVCGRLLQVADTETLDADPEVRADFDQCKTYWTHDFPSLAENTRGSIVLGFSVLIQPLVTRPLRKIFSSDTNVRPEDMFDGKIIICDLAVQDYKLAGKICNLIWKHCCQNSILRRMQPTDRKSFLRPAFIWADEAQNFVTRSDSEFQATARSAGGCSVFLVQNRESFRRVLGNNDTVDSLLGNLQAKFFCQGTGETCEWASGLLGERWVPVMRTSTNQTGNRALVEQDDNRYNSGVSRSEELRRFVEPSRFTTLKRGGALNNFQVECIAYNGGQLFPPPDGGTEWLPYKLLTFDQR